MSCTWAFMNPVVWDLFKFDRSYDVPGNNDRIFLMESIDRGPSSEAEGRNVLVEVSFSN